MGKLPWFSMFYLVTCRPTDIQPPGAGAPTGLTELVPHLQSDPGVSPWKLPSLSSISGVISWKCLDFFPISVDDFSGISLLFFTRLVAAPAKAGAAPAWAKRDDREVHLHDDAMKKGIT